MDKRDIILIGVFLTFLGLAFVAFMARTADDVIWTQDELGYLSAMHNRHPVAARRHVCGPVAHFLFPRHC